jgi:hypothetical protein
MMATGDKATICKIKKQMMNNVEINKDVKLSQHFTLGGALQNKCEDEGWEHTLACTY